MTRQTFCDPVTGESYLLAKHPSGLEIYLMPKLEYSSSYAVFGTRYGSVDTSFKGAEGDVTVPAGIAHFLEHKLFESEDGDAFTRFSATGANANAFTSFDRTCYLFSCTDRFSDNLEILLDFVRSPYFTEKTVSKEQGIIGQEIRMYDDSATWRVLFNMLETMYRQHPVRVDIAGTVESIAEINKDLLYLCYNTFYSLSNMFICIAGNFDVEKALSQIEKGIKSGECKPVIKRSYYEDGAVSADYVEQKLEVSMPLFCLGYKEECSGTRTLKEKVCAELLLDIICSDTSPLYVRLIEEGLINDEFDMEYFTGRDYAVTMFQGESSDPKKTAELIKAEVERLKIEGIDQKEFELAQKDAWGQAVTRTDGNQSAAMALIDCAMFGDGLFDELKILKEITVSDLETALKRLNPAGCVLSVINPAKKER